MANNLKKTLSILATIAGSTAIGSSLIIDNNIQMETTNKGIDSFEDITTPGNATYEGVVPTYDSIEGKVLYTASTLVDEDSSRLEGPSVKAANLMNYVEIVVVESGGDALDDAVIKGNHVITNDDINWDGVVNDPINFKVSDLDPGTEYDIYLLESSDDGTNKLKVGSKEIISTTELKSDPTIEDADIVFENQQSPTSPNGKDGSVDIIVENADGGANNYGEYKSIQVQKTTDSTSLIELVEDEDSGIWKITLSDLTSGTTSFKFTYTYYNGLNNVDGKDSHTKDFILDANVNYGTVGNVVLNEDKPLTPSSITVDVLGNAKNDAHLSEFSVHIANRDDTDPLNSINLPEINRNSITFDNLEPNTEYDIYIFGNKLDNADKSEKGNILQEKTPQISEKDHPTIDLLTTEIVSDATEQEGAQLKSTYTIGQGDNPSTIESIEVSLYRKTTFGKKHLENKTILVDEITGTIKDWNKDNVKLSGRYFTILKVIFDDGHNSGLDIEKESDTVDVVAWAPDTIVIDKPTATAKNEEWLQGGTLTNIQVKIDNIIDTKQVTGTLFKDAEIIWEDIEPTSVDKEVATFPNASNLEAGEYEMKVIDVSNKENSNSADITIGEDLTDKPSIDDNDKPKVVKPGDDGKVTYGDSNLRVLIDTKNYDLIEPKFVFKINGSDKDIEVNAKIETTTYAGPKTYVPEEDTTFDSREGYSIMFEATVDGGNEALTFDLIKVEKNIIEDNGGLSGGAIAGIVVGSLAGATAIGAGSYWYVAKDGASSLKNKLNKTKN